MTHVIELRGLQKVIDQNLVLDIPALTVEAGEVVALVGPVGSGKDALIDLLLGRTRPTAGTLRLAGVDPAADRAQFSRQVGVLFAEDGLYKKSARNNLLFHCQLYGLPKARADQVLAQVGLVDHANVQADKLSSGLARRLAFGRAILHQPKILLLVEPFARCDEATIALAHRLVRQLAEEGVAALILATDVARLAALCDTVYGLNQGRIVEQAPPMGEQRGALPFKIPVKLEDKVVLVNPSDIWYVCAEGGRVYLQMAGERLPTQFTLAELEERLSRSGFFRAHRGYLVNLQHVKEIIPYTRNAFTLILDDAAQTEIPLSKSAAQELRQLLGY